MEKRITDLLDCIQDDTVRLRSKDVASLERIKELTMNKISAFEPISAPIPTMRKPRRRFTVAAAAAIICILAIGTATALALTNTWGIMAFLSRNPENSPILPEAAEIVQVNPTQEGGIVNIVQSEDLEDFINQNVEVDKIQFTIREATFDSHNVVIVIEAKPTSPNYLILAMDAIETDYAHLNTDDKTFLRTYVRVPTQDGSASGDYIIEDDGTFVFYWNFRYEDDSPIINLELICGVILDNTICSENTASIDLDEYRNLPHEEWKEKITELYNTLSFKEFSAVLMELPALDMLVLQDILSQDEYIAVLSELRKKDEVDREAQNLQNDRVESSLFVTLINSGAETVRSFESVYFNGFGFRIDSVTLIGSEMSTYVKIEYTVIDENLYSVIKNDLGFNFLNNEGDIINPGIAGGGITQVGENNTRFRYELSLRAFETMPNEINLQAFNIWDRTVYDTQTLTLR